MPALDRHPALSWVLPRRWAPAASSRTRPSIAQRRFGRTKIGLRMLRLIARDIARRRTRSMAPSISMPGRLTRRGFARLDTNRYIWRYNCIAGCRQEVYVASCRGCAVNRNNVGGIEGSVTREAWGSVTRVTWEESTTEGNILCSRPWKAYALD